MIGATSRCFEVFEVFSCRVYDPLLSIHHYRTDKIKLKILQWAIVVFLTKESASKTVLFVTLRISADFVSFSWTFAECRAEINQTVLASTSVSIDLHRKFAELCRMLNFVSLLVLWPFWSQSVISGASRSLIFHLKSFQWKPPENHLNHSPRKFASKASQTFINFVFHLLKFEEH